MKIKTIKKVTLDEPKQYYDVINANPYNNFLIKTNKGYVGSHNCFFDEVSFQPNQDVEKQKEKAKALVNTAAARMQSRFMKGEINPTILVLASSKRTEQSYMETFIENKKKNQSKTTRVVDEPQWVIREDKNSATKFKVAIGNKFLSSEVIPLDATERDIQLYHDRGFKILDVPIGYYESFIDDIDIALTDIAGISTTSSSRYLSGPRIAAVKRQEIKNPFSNAILEIGNGPEDTTQYYDHFNMDLIDKTLLQYPLYIHLDMSISGDKTGIAGVWIKGKKPPVEGQPPSKELFFQPAFVVSIKAPKGYQISFEKNRQFIYWLKDNGFNIKGVSCFTGDTLISTPNGPMRIDSISIGDDVFAYDDVTHQVVTSKVYNTMNNGPRTEFIKIWVTDSDYIECTPEHPIKTARGYIMAKDIQESDLIEVDDYLFYKSRLLHTNLFIDNQYLDQYVKLIIDNRNNISNGYCENHHIVPACYYNTSSISVDNSDINIVRLSYKNHIHAHYLLSLCAIGDMKFKMTCAMLRMLGNNTNLSEEEFNSFINDRELQEEIASSKELHKKYLSNRMLGNTIRLGMKNSDDMNRRISESNKKPHGIHPKSEFKPGNIPWSKGKNYSQLYTKEERRRKFSRKTSFHWYTNGVDNIRIFEGDDIPDGYQKGRHIIRKRG